MFCSYVTEKYLKLVSKDVLKAHISDRNHDKRCSKHK